MGEAVALAVTALAEVAEDLDVSGFVVDGLAHVEASRVVEEAGPVVEVVPLSGPN